MTEKTEIRTAADNDEIEIDLAEIFYYLKSKLKWLILVFVLGALAAGSLTYWLIVPRYTATAKIYMVSASSESVLNLSDLNLGTSLAEDYAELIKIRPVFNEVADKLGLSYEYEEMLEMVKIETVGNTRLLAVSAESTDPKEAQGIANGLADAAVTYIPRLMETSTPNIAEYAIVPTKKSSPNLAANVIIGALLSTVMLMAVFVVRYVMDDTLNSVEDVEKLFGAMPLTIIPEGEIAAISDQVEHQSKKQRKKRKKKTDKKD